MMKILLTALSVLLCGNVLATEPQTYYEIENYYYEEARADGQNGSSFIF